MKYIFLVIISVFSFSIVHADNTSACIAALSQEGESARPKGAQSNGTIVQTEGDKTRIYTTQGYFEFNLNSSSCPSFKSSSTIYDIYAKAFSKYLSSANYNFNLELQAESQPSIPIAPSERKWFRSVRNMVATCRNVENADFKKKLSDAYEEYTQDAIKQQQQQYKERKRHQTTK